jgi:hypothetical protein
MVNMLRMRVNEVNIKKETESNGNAQKHNENNKNIRSVGARDEIKSKPTKLQQKKNRNQWKQMETARKTRQTIRFQWNRTKSRATSCNKLKARETVRIKRMKAQEKEVKRNKSQ